MINLEKYLYEDYEFGSTQVNIKDKSIINKINSFKDEFNLVKLAKNDEKNYHITVKYGLHTNNVEDVKKVLNKHWKQKYISAELGKVSLFKNDVDVLKIDVKSKDLEKLNSIFSKYLETTDTFPTYIPHLTLGFFKKDDIDFLKNHTFFEGLKVQFKSIIYSSRNDKEFEIQL